MVGSFVFTPQTSPIDSRPWSTFSCGFILTWSNRFGVKAPWNAWHQKWQNVLTTGPGIPRSPSGPAFPGGPWGPTGPVFPTGPSAPASPCEALAQNNTWRSVCVCPWMLTNTLNAFPSWKNTWIFFFLHTVCIYAHPCAAGTDKTWDSLLKLPLQGYTLSKPPHVIWNAVTLLCVRSLHHMCLDKSQICPLSNVIIKVILYPEVILFNVLRCFPSTNP